MALAKLTIDLEAQLAGLQEGLDKAGFSRRALGCQDRKHLRRHRPGVQDPERHARRGLTISGIEQFFRSTVDGLAKLRELSEATGASVENPVGARGHRRAHRHQRGLGGRRGDQAQQGAYCRQRPQERCAAALTAIGLSVENPQAARSRAGAAGGGARSEQLRRQRCQGSRRAGAAGQRAPRSWHRCSRTWPRRGPCRLGHRRAGGRSLRFNDALDSMAKKIRPTSRAPSAGR